MIRREFLAAGATGVVAASVPAGVPAAASASPIPTPAPGALRFDRTAFQAVLDRPYRHKQVFAATQLSGGLVLHYMENSLKAYADGFGEGPGTLHAAAVLYGPALMLAFDDATWAKYQFGEVLNAVPGVKNDPQLAVPRNPFAARVAALAKDGASFFVCNNALNGVVGVLVERSTKVKGRTPLDHASVHDDLAAHLVDGAMIVPAGVAALNAAQEAKFTLVQATVG